MTIRPIRLPSDLPPLVDMLVESFQYPENEAWSVQSDEKESLSGAMRNLRRLWPLIRAMQALSPPLRDLLRGYVWEEDSRLVGATIIQRRGSTDVWYVSTVAVLPAYRRRSIARQLLAAALDLIRSRAGVKAFLSVIDGNLPAYALYEKIGFEHYGGNIEFQATPQTAPPLPALPGGYVLSPLGRMGWRPVYELAKRTAPPNREKYEPVELGRFRPSPMKYLLRPLLAFAEGTRAQRIAVHTAAGGQVVASQIVAWGEYTIPTRGKGLNTLRARLDPAHPALAPYLVRYLLHKAVTSSPGRRVEFSVPQWMEETIAAAEEAGFERRLAYCQMGLVL